MTEQHIETAAALPASGNDGVNAPQQQQQHHQQQQQQLPQLPALPPLSNSGQQDLQSQKARQRRVWTPEEDERLRLLVSYWGDQCGKNGHWDKISAHFEHRSNKDCRKRWFHSLDPKLKRGRWTEHEDKVLVDAYEKMGPVWHRIAQLIPGRTDDQCSKRYNDVLDPSISTRLRNWSPEEDQKLLDLVSSMGTQWRKIANEMDGRTGLTCRNRWRKISAKLHKGIQPQAESTAAAGNNGAGDPSSNAFNELLPNGSTTTIPAAAPLSVMNHNNQFQNLSQQTLQNVVHGNGLKDDVHNSSPMSVGSMDSPESSISTISKRSPVIGSTPSATGAKPKSQPIPPPMVPADSTTTTTHYTFTVDPEVKEHQSLTPRELDELIQVARKHGQSIIVHQHNYHHHHYHGGAPQRAPVEQSMPSQPPTPLASNPQTNTSSKRVDPTRQPGQEFSNTHVAGQPQQQQQQPQPQSSQPQQHHQTQSQSRSQTPLGGGTGSNNISAAPTPSNLFNIDLPIGLNENVIPEFDDELGLDFESFDGIPFNPS